jgi:hypothetical protein
MQCPLASQTPGLPLLWVQGVPVATGSCRHIRLWQLSSIQGLCIAQSAALLQQSAIGVTAQKPSAVQVTS